MPMSLWATKTLRSSTMSAHLIFTRIKNLAVTLLASKTTLRDHIFTSGTVIILINIQNIEKSLY